MQLAVDPTHSSYLTVAIYEETQIPDRTDHGCSSNLISLPLLATYGGLTEASLKDRSVQFYILQMRWH